MTPVDWAELDQAAQRTLRQERMSQAVHRGLEAGEAAFRRRLLLRIVMAVAGVATVVVLGFILREIVHADPADPVGPDGALPTVTGISPARGSTAGGTEVTITGTGFTEAARVRFGGTAATEVSYVSDRKLLATSPPGTGTVAVIVRTSDGTSSRGPAARFTYVAGRPPAVLGIEPDRGSSTGGTLVTITGRGFVGRVTVSFGDQDGGDVQVLSATRLVTTSPAGTGTVPVTVTTPRGTSQAGAAARFTYVVTPTPTVTGLDPPSGTTKGGTEIAISGRGFTQDATVTFGDDDATNVRFVSVTRLEVTSPPGTGTVTVTVSTANGDSPPGPASEFEYVVLPAPAVTGVNPSSGSTDGGDTVVVTGSGFTPDAGVDFGGVAAETVRFVSSTELLVTTPASGVAATVPVTVSTPDGTSAEAPKATFRYVPPPTVSRLEPTEGTTAGGTRVTIVGTGFTPGAAVLFGASRAAVEQFVSPTELEVTSPPGSGTVAVTVSTDYGVSATGPQSEFDYISIVDRRSMRRA